MSNLEHLVSDASERFGRSYRVYAKTGALTFQCQISRQHFPCVGIDGTTAKRDGAFDWSGKLSLQLSHSELPRLAAFFSGYVPQVEFNYHGGSNNKSVSFKAQNGGCYVVMRCAERQISVPVAAGDVFYVRAMVFLQMARMSEATISDVATLMELQHKFAQTSV